ncbi:MAG: Penicillin-binding protein, 1A family [Candidatus Yanofskybacteria bacterium GW2011_GWA1_44_21]|uniref:Penicillin-binding protein, 1A family n=3 Tax=Parcubacteria group TaxID=1794811 RepID=A0A0G0XL45_9BACT|nr:MAG: Penicillin-binding protein, 1A family [Candidatus Wolfebacteria bacterium GW2011_GWA2_42_10]KKT50324.1 MAG: Penicillin-binding protein, 1A family [Candidatus Yanofskybacteria bacterium GW2011_GWA1_44_21]KKT90163.1 MAG: Penicillin-binding protein, 1A family [Candidatus Yanofskybacteria bacterium GW2011_GWB1_45_11]
MIKNHLKRMMPFFRFNKRLLTKGFFLNIFKKMLVLAAWVVVVGSIIFLVLFIYYQQSLPDPEAIASRRVNESTKIYDRTGETLLYDIHGEEKRTIIPWDKIPQNLKNAALVAEDSNFYNHNGIDFKGIARAFIKNIEDFDLSQGGSTITQQLVRNALLGQQKTISRKLKEAILSIEVERRFSKDQIFWMYLNEIPYGSNTYGVEAASKTYFGKSVSDISLAESAILAALPRATTYYSPYGNHVDALLARKDFVLKRMLDLKYISQSEYESAVNEKVAFKPNLENIRAPHFVLMVKEYLTRKYGDDVVENGGLKVITTLDSNLQEIAEEVVQKYSKINKERYRANNSALVSLDPKTGNVLALVGSSNYFDVENQGNFNVVTSPNRQPGSSFKPFAYATALARGYTDSTILFDYRTEFNPYCSPDSSQLRDRYGLSCYHPQNYDGVHRGPVTMRQALSQSLNIPSVQVLYLAGIKNTTDTAEKMGITTLNKPSGYGLSLVLGGAEVRPIDMVSAYGVFANDGVRNPWEIVLRVETGDGTVLEDKKNQPIRVLDSQIARLVNNMLSDNTARAPIFGYNSPLYFPGRDVAAKTGTTQENRDAWVVGYTPNIATAVWSGNNNNTPMTQAGAGISASGPMWHEFMNRAFAYVSEESFIKPDPVNVGKIMLNGDYAFYKDDASTPEYHNILYYVKKEDPLGNYPANPQEDPLFHNWEWPIQNYLGSTAI